MFDETPVAVTNNAPRQDLTALMYGGSSGQSTTPGLFASDAL